MRHSRHCATRFENIRRTTTSIFHIRTFYTSAMTMPVCNALCLLSMLSEHDAAFDSAKQPPAPSSSTNIPTIFCSNEISASRNQLLSETHSINTRSRVRLATACLFQTCQPKFGEKAAEPMLVTESAFECRCERCANLHVLAALSYLISPSQRKCRTYQAFGTSTT